MVIFFKDSTKKCLEDAIFVINRIADDNDMSSVDVYRLIEANCAMCDDYDHVAIRIPIVLDEEGDK